MRVIAFEEEATDHRVFQCGYADDGPWPPPERLVLLVAQDGETWVMSFTAATLTTDVPDGFEVTSWRLDRWSMLPENIPGIARGARYVRNGGDAR
jgi:hypothetical protein